jgi:DNA-binding MarR family transcriptional regulator
MKKDDDAPEELALGLSNRLFFRLYQCANMMHKTGTKALDEHRVTTQQWAIIGALSRPGMENGITVGELAAFLMVSRQNLAGMLSRLETQGYIERTVDAKDNRSRRIRLNTRGRALWFEQLLPKIARYYEDALQGFSTEDKIHTVHYLSTLLENLKQLDPEEPS